MTEKLFQKLVLEKLETLEANQAKFATKKDLDEQIDTLARITNDQFEIARKERAELMNAIAHVWSDHEERISRLEEVT
jgi:hypothetical protein